MSEDFAEIQLAFVEEAREHLSAIEPDLLQLERLGAGAPPDLVNRVFRAIHSIKGGASFLSFEALKRLSHVMENVLMRVRDKELVPGPEVTDALLRGVDRLRAMMEDVETSDRVECASELAQLNAILDQGPAPAPPLRMAAVPDGSAPLASPVASTPVAPPRVPSALTAAPVVPSAAPAVPPPSGAPELLQTVPMEALRAARAKGQSLYEVALPVGTHADEVSRSFAGLGDCLAVSEGDGAVPARILCATVLDPALLANALVVPTDHITVLGGGTPPPPAALAPTRDAEPARPGEERTEVLTQETLRVRVDLLTRLMNVAGELVLGRNQLLRALKSEEHIAGLSTILQHVDRVTTELQEGIMQTRMQPIGALFGRYTRLVRDLARQLGKEVQLTTQGSDVELDKSIIEALADPLAHIIRNAVDHAIEAPLDRRLLGKPAAGQLVLRAFHESGQVNVVVSDDGRGIDTKRVLAKAVEKGLVTQAAAATMSDRDLAALVMLPGFSTAERVTDVSGRGVGMDVVRTNVERLGGHVELESERGLGTSVRLRLPLTLAIIPSLVVRVEQARFAVPQVNIVELVWVRSDEAETRIEHAHGAPVLRLRGRLLPLVRLSEVLRMPRGEVGTPRESFIIVLRAGSNRFGLVVDELLEPEEIVVKPLPAHVKSVSCFAGTTILGDGKVTMILDAAGVAARAALSFASIEREERRRAAAEAQASSGAERRSVILFEGAPGEVFAVSQELVLRLERIDPHDVRSIAGTEYLDYRGRGLPLLRLDALLPVSGAPADTTELFVLIPRVGRGRASEARVGILVWRIVDAIEVDVALGPPLFAAPGVEGAAMLNGRLTTFIDPVRCVEATRFVLPEAS